MSTVFWVTKPNRSPLKVRRKKYCKKKITGRTYQKEKYWSKSKLRIESTSSKNFIRDKINNRQILFS